jgi:hypothetical protein
MPTPWTQEGAAHALSGLTTLRDQPSAPTAIARRGFLQRRWRGRDVPARRSPRSRATPPPMSPKPSRSCGSTGSPLNGSTLSLAVPDRFPVVLHWLTMVKFAGLLLTAVVRTRRVVEKVPSRLMGTVPDLMASRRCRGRERIFTPADFLHPVVPEIVILSLSVAVRGLTLSLPASATPAARWSEQIVAMMRTISARRMDPLRGLDGEWPASDTPSGSSSQERARPIRLRSGPGRPSHRAGPATTPHPCFATRSPRRRWRACGRRG